MPSFEQHWQQFVNLVSDKGSAFFLGFLIGYVVRAIKI